MFKRFVIILSLLGIVYIPLRMLITVYSLEEVRGTIKELHKSSTRIPYYTFILKEYSCTFYNKGNGALSLLKDPPESGKKPTSLMIKSTDRSLLSGNQPVFYFAFNKKNKLIDVYYSIVRSGLFSHFMILSFYFFILVFNVMGAYRYPKQELFVNFIKLYLLLVFLLMFL
ncbi:hypothetical protein [Chryseobacterium sp. M5A1_1a]